MRSLGGGRPVGAHGAGGQRDLVAPAQPAEDRRSAPGSTRCRPSRAAPTRSASSSGGRRAPAPSASTPRCSRTPAPTPRCSRASARSAPTCGELRPVVGGRVAASVALLFDWPSWWAAEEPGRPTERLRHPRAGAALAPRAVAPGHRRRPRASPAPTCRRTAVVLVPHSYIVETDAAAALRAAVEARREPRGRVRSRVSPTRTPAILTGRSPVLLRDLVGVSGEEWVGLPDAPTPRRGAGRTWATAPGGGRGIRARRAPARRGRRGARPLRGGHLAGAPAVTRHRVGEGTAWYLGAVAVGRRARRGPRRGARRRRRDRRRAGPRAARRRRGRPARRRPLPPQPRRGDAARHRARAPAGISCRTRMSTARPLWPPAPPWCSSKGTQSEVHRWLLAHPAGARPAVRGRGRRHPPRRGGGHHDGVRADGGDPRPRRHPQPRDADGDLLGAGARRRQGAGRAARGRGAPRTGLRGLRRGGVPPRRSRSTTRPVSSSPGRCARASSRRRAVARRLRERRARAHQLAARDRSGTTPARAARTARPAPRAPRAQPAPPPAARSRPGCTSS